MTTSHSNLPILQMPHMDTGMTPSDHVEIAVPLRRRCMYTRLNICHLESSTPMQIYRCCVGYVCHGCLNFLRAAYEWERHAQGSARVKRLTSAWQLSIVTAHFKPIQPMQRLSSGGHR